MYVFNDVWTSGAYRTNRAYHYKDLELGPELDRIVQGAFEDKATVREAMVEANRVGNAQVEFGGRCYKPGWRPR